MEAHANAGASTTTDADPFLHALQVDQCTVACKDEQHLSLFRQVAQLDSHKPYDSDLQVTATQTLE
jgi:hypothetical protein